MLEVNNIYKTFNPGTVNEKLALDGLSLKLKEGDFVTVIGGNGAGKSTLLNALAGVWFVDEGQIIIDGKDVTKVPEHKRAAYLGRVFQDPMMGTAATMGIDENMALAMRRGKSRGLRIGITQKERNQFREMLKVLDLGLEDRLTSKVGLLSGGQRQRVAIARALASDPKILLCDEATSALDPQTTASILSLLKEINEKLGITIVIITHQMSVIREICSHVAIIEHGVLVEDGLVEDIFSHPKSKAAKELILRDQPGNNNAPLANAVQERMQGDKKIRIVFSENSAFEPVIANMILQFGKPVNILRADTKNVGGVAKGEMILGLPEDRHLQVDIEEYLKEKGLAVEEVTEDVE